MYHIQNSYYCTLHDKGKTKETSFRIGFIIEWEVVIFHNNTFVISQCNFKEWISLTTYYTSAINISKVRNFGFKFR